jgi:hypothetical protein
MEFKVDLRRSDVFSRRSRVPIMSIRREVWRWDREVQAIAPGGTWIVPVDGGRAVVGPVVPLVSVLTVDLNEIERWWSVDVLHLLHGSVGEAVDNVHRGNVLDILLVVHGTTRSLLGSLGSDVHGGDGLVSNVDSENSVGCCFVSQIIYSH